MAGKKAKSKSKKKVTKRRTRKPAGQPVKPISTTADPGASSTSEAEG